MESAVSQYVSPSTYPQTVSPTAHFQGVEDRFIENWGRLAESIGMDETLGRVHAALYLGSTPLDARALAEQLGLDPDDCDEHLRTLVAFGAIREDDAAGGDAVYVAERDPWSWFMRTIRERARREFSPLLQSIRAVNTLAQEARSANSAGLDPERAARIERIGRFTCFVDQVSGLMETFSSLGAAPLMATMRLASKFVK